LERLFLILLLEATSNYNSCFATNLIFIITMKKPQTYFWSHFFDVM